MDDYEDLYSLWPLNRYSSSGALDHLHRDYLPMWKDAATPLDFISWMKNQK